MKAWIPMVGALLGSLPVPAAAAGAQAPGEVSALARDPVLFLRTAEKTMHWSEPAPPARIVGPLYFVGTRGLAAFLLTTSEGHLLLNTGMPGSGPMIENSIRQLGLKPEDIRLMLVGHAHVDHAGGFAYLKKLSGARIAALAEEVDLLASGGRRDFHYGAHREFYFDPVTADHVLRDGESLRLGDVVFTARHTPGHTRGSTTWVTNIVADGRVYTVVFPNGAGINPGYRLVEDPSYPGIADDYRRTFPVLEMLRPDIWLDAHTDVFDYERRLARAAREGVAAWVDPEGYRKWVVSVRATFEARVEDQSAVRVRPK